MYSTSGDSRAVANDEGAITRRTRYFQRMTSQQQQSFCRGREIALRHSLEASLRPPPPPTPSRESLTSILFHRRGQLIPRWEETVAESTARDDESITVSLPSLPHCRSLLVISEAGQRRSLLPRCKKIDRRKIILSHP